GDVAAQLGGEGGDGGVADAARHDPVEVGQVAVAVDGEPVQRGGPADPDADRGDLAVRAAGVGGHPHAAAALHAGGRDPEVGADGDQHVLDAADVGDHVDRVRQAQDRVPDELARAVPGDLAAAVHVAHRRAV